MTWYEIANTTALGQNPAKQLWHHQLWAALWDWCCPTLPPAPCPALCVWLLYIFRVSFSIYLMSSQSKRCCEAIALRKGCEKCRIQLCVICKAWGVLGRLQHRWEAPHVWCKWCLGAQHLCDSLVHTGHTPHALRPVTSTSCVRGIQHQQHVLDYGGVFRHWEIKVLAPGFSPCCFVAEGSGQQRCRQH